MAGGNGNGKIRQRPIYGGVFGKGRYSLATVPCIARGLHAVRYMVVEPRAGSVLSVADDKTQALSGARRLLQATAALTRQEAKDAEIDSLQESLWPDEVLAPSEPGLTAKNTSRRKREIFELSQGKCHYCGTVLQLDGKWHVEHQMPKALGGDDGIVNLAAACVPCNLSKRDMTALEFVSIQGESY